jgi:hypothetical protein
MENLIEEILTQLIEEAVEIKANATDDFAKGKLFGYYASISKILNQAEAFGLSDKLPENLQEFNPEDLLSEIN